MTVGLDEQRVYDYIKLREKIEEERRTKVSKDKNQKLAIAKELINNADDDILEAVDEHVSGLIAKFDEEKMSV